MEPPENLKRVPGPKAILYYLSRDETLRERGLRLPTSTRTIWQLLDQLGLIERAAPRHRKPLELQEPLQEVQVDFKDVTTVGADPTAPTEKRQHLVEVCNFVDAGSSRLLAAQVHEDFHAETAFDAVVQFLREYGLPDLLTLDRDVRWVGSEGKRDPTRFSFSAAPVPVVRWRPAQCSSSAPSRTELLRGTLSQNLRQGVHRDLSSRNARRGENRDGTLSGPLQSGKTASGTHLWQSAASRRPSGVVHQTSFAHRRRSRWVAQGP